MRNMRLNLLMGWPPELNTWPTRSQWPNSWPSGWPTGWPVNPAPVDIPAPTDIVSEEV